jgi:signal transduction histidine kinase
MIPNTKIWNKNNNLIIWVFSGIIILTIYFIGHSYSINLSQSKKAVLDELSAIVNTAASMMDGDLHQQVSSKYLVKDAITSNTQDSSYQTLHEILKQIHSVNKLQTPLYTMVYNPQSAIFEFICSSSQAPYYRHGYRRFPKKLLADKNIGGTLDVYASETGYWLSAFAPIKDSSGNVVGLIQADHTFVAFFYEAKVELIKNISLALLIMLPFTFLLFAYMKRTLSSEKDNHAILLEKNTQIALQNTFIQENNNKLKASKIIIEQKNIELNAQVHERTKKLLEANSELSTFLYRSSHDIQGPLSTLRGLCQLAKKEVGDPQASEYVKMINDTTNKIYHTIKSISNVYEIKRKEIQSENIMLKPLMTEVSKIFEREMKDKEIAISIDIHDNLSVRGDREITLLVLSELIKNSIQFSASSHGKAAYIKVLAQESNGDIQIEIEDNGIGIPLEVHHLIFEMFQRGNTYSKGAGLGLYTAKIGIEKLNGSIQLITDNPNITSFRIIVPAA